MTCACGHGARFCEVGQEIQNVKFSLLLHAVCFAFILTFIPAFVVIPQWKTFCPCFRNTCCVDKTLADMATGCRVSCSALPAPPPAPVRRPRARAPGALRRRHRTAGPEMSFVSYSNFVLSPVFNSVSAGDFCLSFSSRSCQE